jgi:ABC-type sugar transport system ATPase subunit
MSHKPRFLIAAHPTRGVDVGAQAAIWDHIREARREGLAVLLISADLDELIGLSDTLRVIYNGKLVADADPATITPEELGSAMTGAASGHLENEELEHSKRAEQTEESAEQAELEEQAEPKRRQRSKSLPRRRRTARQTPRKTRPDEEVRQGALLLAVAGPVIALVAAIR